MSLIFSAGNKRPQWAGPAPKKQVKTAQVGGLPEETNVEEDSMLEAIRNVPGVGLDVIVKDTLTELDTPEVITPEVTIEESPKVDGLPSETSPAGAEAVTPETPEAKAVEEVKVKLDEAQQAVEKLEAVTKGEEVTEVGAEGEITAPVDEVEVELETKPEGEEVSIPGVKEDKSEDKSEDKVEDKKEKKEKAEVKKESTEKSGEKQEKEGCGGCGATASTTQSFVRVAKLSSKNRSDLRDYWLNALGFPSEYVDEMLKDYED